MSVWFHRSGYVLAVVTAFFILKALYGAMRHRAHRYDGLYTAVMLLWGFGVGCKVAGFGPDVFRFWLADVGFPVFIGWGLWDLTRGRTYRAAYSHATTHAQRLSLLIGQVSERKVTLLVALGASYAYEILCGILVPIARKNAPPDAFLPGAFDWWDMLAYTGGSAFGWLMLHRWIRWLESWREEAYERDLSEQRARARAGSPKPPARQAAERSLRGNRRRRRRRP